MVFQAKDLTGLKFGRLTAIERHGSNKRGSALWLCQCECGATKYVPSRYLLSGSTRSCGSSACKKEINDRKGIKNPCYKHGKSHHRLYVIYQNMKQRCYNEKAAEFNCYGGKGVEVCSEWLNSFETFFDWAINNGYKDDLTIDRIDNDGNYEPSNCQWLTKSDNLIKAGIDREKKNRKQRKKEKTS